MQLVFGNGLGSVKIGKPYAGYDIRNLTQDSSLESPKLARSAEAKDSIIIDLGCPTTIQKIVIAFEMCDQVTIYGGNAEKIDSVIVQTTNTNVSKHAFDETLKEVKEYKINKSNIFTHIKFDLENNSINAGWIVSLYWINIFGLPLK